VSGERSFCMFGVIISGETSRRQTGKFIYYRSYLLVSCVVVVLARHGRIVVLVTRSSSRIVVFFFL
jgi:hypothetical protein